MTTIISGGRDYRLTDDDFRWLDTLGISEVVTGGCRGTDIDAFDWAWDRRIPVQIIKADWENFGISAGPRRNRRMALIAQQCVLFPGGIGTASMAIEAEKLGLKIIYAPTQDKPFPTPKADSSPDCTAFRSSDGSTSNGGH